LALDGHKEPVERVQCGSLSLHGDREPSESRPSGGGFFSGCCVRPISSVEGKSNPLSSSQRIGLAARSRTSRERSRQMRAHVEGDPSSGRTFRSQHVFRIQSVARIATRPAQAYRRKPNTLPGRLLPPSLIGSCHFHASVRLSGLVLECRERRILLNRPSLPESRPAVWIEGLQLRGASVESGLRGQACGARDVS